MSLELDKQVVGDALEGKEKLNLYALKRLILTELAYNGVFQENKFCGFSKKEICDAVAHPERYGKRILKLSKYMYLKSGYYKRLVKYYSTMAKYYWTVDTEVRSIKFEETSNKTLKSGLYRFIDRVNRLRLEYELERIISTMMINDACFGYLVETEYDSFIFYLPAECCEITHVVNGVLGFSINVGFYTKNKQKILLKREGLGLGDVKFMTAAGLCLGLKSSFFSTLVSCVVAAVVLSILSAINKNTGKREYPFIPFLGSGCIIGYFYGERLVELYLSLFIGG